MTCGANSDPRGWQLSVVSYAGRASRSPRCSCDIATNRTPSTNKLRERKRPMDFGFGEAVSDKSYARRFASPGNFKKRGGTGVDDLLLR